MIEYPTRMRSGEGEGGDGGDSDGAVRDRDNSEGEMLGRSEVCTQEGRKEPGTVAQLGREKFVMSGN